MMLAEMLDVPYRFKDHPSLQMQSLLVEEIIGKSCVDVYFVEAAYLESHGGTFLQGIRNQSQFVFLGGDSVVFLEKGRTWWMDQISKD
jgi:hypothetical protein